MCDESYGEVFDLKARLGICSFGQLLCKWCVEICSLRIKE